LTSELVRNSYKFRYSLRMPTL